jgi:hypothetical protein
MIKTYGLTHPALAVRDTEHAFHFISKSSVQWKFIAARISFKHKHPAAATCSCLKRKSVGRFLIRWAIFLDLKLPRLWDSSFQLV